MTSKKRKPTLSKDAKRLFQETFFEWQERFGLQEWATNIEVSDDLEDESIEASIETEPESRTALVCVAKHPRCMNTEAEIKATAIHEAVHLLLADFSHAATDRYTDRETLVRVEETLVNRITSLCMRLLELEREVAGE
jgi:hypothetical protein